MAMLNKNGKGKATKLAKFSNEEEALIPSSVRFIYQRPTATSTASATSSADVSTGSVRQGGATEPQASPIPERLHRTHFDQPLSSTSTPPMRGKLMSESDAGRINDTVGVAHPPVVPRRPHPPNPRHETSSGAGGVNLSPAAKAKKPPMPPPRLKTNAGPHHEVTPRSPRLSPSHHVTAGGGGGKTAAKLSDTEMKIQTLILSDPEFQGCSPDVCLKLLKRHGFEMSSAKEDIRVHMLMEMGIEHIETEDCRRALSHCQQKMDRAAEWLLEQSADIERRRQ